MSKLLSGFGLVCGLMVMCSAKAQELGAISLRENGHAGWQQANVFIPPDKPTLSFDWHFNLNAYHGDGASGYVIWQQMSVGYDGYALDQGPLGLWPVYLWSQAWHYVGSESTTIPAEGFTGHQELDLSALAGQTVSLWFYLDYVGNDSANDSVAWFNNLAVTPIPEPGSHYLLLLGLGGFWLLKGNGLRSYVPGNPKV